MAMTRDKDYLPVLYMMVTLIYVYFQEDIFAETTWKILIVKNMRGATSVLGQKCECEAENDKHKNEKIFPPYPYLVTYN